MHLARLIPNLIYDYDLHHAAKGTKFTYKGLKTKAKVVDIYDGDTLTLVFRYRGQLQEHSVRMLGYDSPEKKPLRSKPDRDREISAAIAAKKALERMVGGVGSDTTTIVTLVCDDFDKFGRILGTVYTGRGILQSKTNVNEWMIENGYGIPYKGGTKAKMSFVNNKCVVAED